MFSNRLEWNLAPNRIGNLLKAKRSRGESIIDLTESNPTRVGLDYPGQAILSALAHPAATTYAPDPRGMAVARAAIAAYYRAQRVTADPSAFFLTASTSEAYSMLFKLLADPGDEILIPRPGYPLLSYLADFDSLCASTYPLRHDPESGWTIDLELLRALITARTRAVVVVHPNNPTGSYIGCKQLSALDQICSQHHMALIVDEVFNDYRSADATIQNQSALTRTRCLTFVLNGFSKMVALPQLKLAWIAVGGEQGIAEAACDRLETQLDFYLSVNTPVQLAAAELLALRDPIQRAVQHRLTANSRWLSEIVAATTAMTLLRRDGGWYAVVDIMDAVSDEERVLRLLDEGNTLVHPGFFYDFHREGFVVLSLLPEERLFQEGIFRLISCSGKATTSRGTADPRR